MSFSVCVKDELKNHAAKRNNSDAAFLKDSFLEYGWINDPQKKYHLEFVYSDKESAVELLEKLKSFGWHAKTINRNTSHVVYMKEAEDISDFLAYTGAHKSMMDFENARIYKNVNNSVNRAVNCETANITKTINAYIKQSHDIKFIQRTKGLDILTDKLKETAMLRLNNPEMSIEELCELLKHPVSKSGLYHRLHKIEEIAKRISAENKININ
jgi:DNA-binding protein WhiA